MKLCNPNIPSKPIYDPFDDFCRNLKGETSSRLWIVNVISQHR
jgi:hypothetical protein